MTGCCYLAGAVHEEKLLKDLRAGGAPHVITAARAIRLLLGALGCRRVALVAPYPAWVVELAKTYWQSSGLEIVAIVHLPDVVSIYAVNTDKVVAAVREVATVGAEAIVLSGNGRGDLAGDRDRGGIPAVPVISSNLSLGWWISNAGRGAPLATPSPALRSVYRWIKSP